MELLLLLLLCPTAPPEGQDLPAALPEAANDDSEHEEAPPAADEGPRVRDSGEGPSGMRATSVSAPRVPSSRRVQRVLPSAAERLKP